LIFRLACALVVAAQLVLLGLYLRPSGRSAIAFTFVGTPLLAIGILLAIVWVLRVYRRIRHAKVDRGNRDDGPALRAS
jgi:hypothetical protein